MKHSIIAVLAIVLGVSAVASADLIVDWGGTGYVSSDTVLSDGSHTFAGGNDGTFMTKAQGTLTFTDASAGDELSTNQEDDEWLIMWAAEDVAAGGVGTAFDFTTLPGDENENMVWLSAGGSDVPRTRIVVEVGGVFYASTKSKTNGSTKTYSRSDIEGQDPEFQEFSLANFSVDSTSTINFADLTNVTSVGLHIRGDEDRSINGFQAFGTIVPEPATMSLLALGGLGALLKRRRK